MDIGIYSYTVKRWFFSNSWTFYAILELSYKSLEIAGWIRFLQRNSWITWAVKTWWKLWESCRIRFEKKRPRYSFWKTSRKNWNLWTQCFQTVLHLHKEDVSVLPVKNTQMDMNRWICLMRLKSMQIWILLRLKRKSWFHRTNGKNAPAKKKKISLISK